MYLFINLQEKNNWGHLQLLAIFSKGVLIFFRHPLGRHQTLSDRVKIDHISSFEYKLKLCKHMHVVEILYVRSNTTGTLYRVYC